MMHEQFEHDFIKRTLKIIEQYEKFVETRVSPSEKFEVTLLINCLLGLLVIPYSRRTSQIRNIPLIPIEQLEEWGIKKESIKSWGDAPENQHNLKQIIHRMRNSVAHNRIRLRGNNSEITIIDFNDQNGFNAELSIDGLKIFVTKLAHFFINAD